MRWLLLLPLIPACAFQAVPSDQILVETRGVKVIDVILVGPGGDGIHGEFEPVLLQGLVLTSSQAACFILGSIIMGVLVIWQSRQKKP